MGLFSNKKKEDNLPRELPALPDLGPVPERNPYANPVDSQPSTLPQFPSNNDMMSQRIIKNAVSGQREGDFEVGLDENESGYEPEFSRNEVSPQKTMGYTRPAYIDEEYKERVVPTKTVRQTQEKNPFEVHKDDSVFIQIDKFNEISKTMKSVRIKIADIEKTISKIQRMREEEENELISWENEIKKIRAHVDNIDQNIFEKL